MVYGHRKIYLQFWLYDIKMEKNVTLAEFHSQSQNSVHPNKKKPSTSFDAGVTSVFSFYYLVILTIVQTSNISAGIPRAWTPMHLFLHPTPLPDDGWHDKTIPLPFCFNPAGFIATLLTRKPGAGTGLVGDKPTMLQIVVIDIILVAPMLMIIAILNVSL